MNHHIPTILAIAAALAADGLSAPASAATRCQDVLRYLKADVENLQDSLQGMTRGAAIAVRKKGFVLRWGATPPAVLFIAGTPEAAEMAKSDAGFAVWAINGALPKNWQMPFGGARNGRMEDNTIKVAYLPGEYWPASITKSEARAFTQFTKEGEIRAAIILPDYTRLTEERHRVYSLLHEMLHALGRAHVDRSKFPETIMHPKAYRGTGVALRSLDKAALRAVYKPPRAGRHDGCNPEMRQPGARCGRPAVKQKNVRPGRDGLYCVYPFIPASARRAFATVAQSSTTSSIVRAG